MSTGTHTTATTGSARLGIAAAVTATVFWASAAVLGKAIEAPTLVMLTWREVFAVTALLAFAAARGHRFRRADLLASAPAMPLFAVHVTLFFAAVELTSVAIVVLIYALAPLILIPLGAWRFGERPAPVVWLLALVTLGGIALVVTSGESHGSNPRLGVLISILNVFGWVAFSFGSKGARARGVPTLTWLLAANVGALVFTFVGCLLHGDSLGAVSGADWPRIVALGLIPGLVGHGLMIWAYRSVDVSLTSVIAVGEPVLSAAGAALFLGERLRVSQVVGIVIVCGAVAGVAYLGGRSTTRVRRPLTP
jgi:drug/metabolite transporter (DMT)-like permease